MKNFTIKLNYLSKTIFCLLTFMLFAFQGFAQPAFTKIFTPSTIGPGSTSVLTFTIDNTGGVTPVTSLDFTDILPGSGTVVIASPAVITNNCPVPGTVTAVSGGTTINFTGGAVPAGGFCSITIQVTSVAVGTHTNLTGDLTSSAGNSGTATADLIVASTLPGFSKSFMPAIVDVGDRSTLTFTFDNLLNGSRVGNLDFTDNLPTGLVIANPSNASTTCISASAPNTILTAAPGASVITLNAAGNVVFPGLEVLSANSTCFVTVDVIVEGTGTLENTTGVSEADFVSVGFATAQIIGVRSDIHITKEFLADPTPPGGTVDLEFTITNFDRDFSATNVTFSDDLNAVLPGLVATGLPMTNVCGVGSTLMTAVTSTTSFELTGGTIASNGGTCTFTVSLQIPATATAGTYSNTSSTVTGTVDGNFVIGNTADDDLFISPAPTITKTFLDNPVEAGTNTTLEFTITNTSTTDALTDIAFTDDLTNFFGGVFPITGTPPAGGFCGGGSTIAIGTCGLDCSQIEVTNGSLAANSSCTFTVEVMVPAGLSGGTYTNTTSELTGTVNAEAVTGIPATDDLIINSAPTLTKSFANDPVSAGGTVDLEFSIDLTGNAPTDATNISFTDDLDATLSGLVATGLPMTDICGTGSSLTGTSTLTFSVGTLSAGSTCTFTVTLQVPAGAAPGSYTNTTSEISATVNGVGVTNTAASDDLLVNPLTVTKEFINDPVLPGELATLRFTLDLDASAPGNATIFLFSDALGSMVAGAASESGTLNDICGIGSSISGTMNLSFFGGAGPNLTPGTSCTFDIQVRIPPGTASGDYTNTTSSIISLINGVSVINNPATDILSVNNETLTLNKSFTNSPVIAGSTVDLAFTVGNLNANSATTNITFTDDLDAVVTGLVATGLPMNNICGTGSSLSGTNLLTFSAGTLPAASTCTFTVTLAVPATAGGNYTNTTTQIAGDINGNAVTGNIATADLSVQNVNFAMTYGASAAPGATTTLTFDIANLDGVNPVNALAFTNDLDAVLSGLTVVGLPMNNVCGAGSTLSGTSTIAFGGGSLAAGGSCSFTVTVQVPADANPANYPNSTSAISGTGASGLFSTTAATSTLIIASGVPTLSEWGLIILALLFMIFGTVKVYQKNLVFARTNLPSGATESPRFLLDKAVLRKSLWMTFALAILAGILSLITTETITVVDMIGTVVAGPMLAYLIHLMIIMERKDKENAA